MKKEKQRNHDGEPMSELSQNQRLLTLSRLDGGGR